MGNLVLIWNENSSSCFLLTELYLGFNFGWKIKICLIETEWFSDCILKDWINVKS